MAIELGGNITLDHCLIAGSSANFGGAMAASFTGGLVLDHCTVTGNTARSAGAGFYIDTAGALRMTDTIACCCPAGEIAYCQGGAATADHCDVWKRPFRQRPSRVGRRVGERPRLEAARVLATGTRGSHAVELGPPQVALALRATGRQRSGLTLVPGLC